VFAAVVCGLALDATTTGMLPAGATWVAVAATLAVLATLYREFFRMLLFAHRRSVEVLKADVIYSIVLICSAVLATFSTAAAALAALGLACAALVGGLMCSRSMWRIEPWNVQGAPGTLRAIAPLGLVTATGSGIHWMFSQGYNFLVAATLDVPSVAAIAATRILIMPVNLLSSGIGTIMLPTASGWLQTHPATVVLRRLMMIAFSLATAALIYFAVLWLIRDWVFTVILKKQVAQRDSLLLLWYAVGILMLLRDQLVYLLLARSRFHALTVLTLVSALVALATSYVGMKLAGVAGALVGVLVGETLNVTGMLMLSTIEVRKRPGEAVAT
jgi:O-antigen/teichoic acid export membrane protein